MSVCLLCHCLGPGTAYTGNFVSKSILLKLKSQELFGVFWKICWYPNTKNVFLGNPSGGTGFHTAKYFSFEIWSCSLDIVQVTEIHIHLISSFSAALPLQEPQKKKPLPQRNIPHPTWPTLPHSHPSDNFFIFFIFIFGHNTYTVYRKSDRLGRG